MPYYTFIDKETLEVVGEPDQLMMISEMEAFLKKNPKLDTKPPTVGCGFIDAFKLGIRKPSQDFRDTLKHIKAKHRGSTINTF